MTKRIFLFLVIIVSNHLCKAQFYKSFLPSAEFSAALEKIVVDFRVNFKTIQGNSLLQQSESEVYESTVKLPGSEDCVIYNYHSVKDTSASWQAVMYRGTDFNDAANTYKNVFKLVRKSHITWIDKSSAGFTGELEPPREDVRFAVSTLRFNLNDRRYKNFEAQGRVAAYL